MRPLSEIIIHCAATRASWMADAPLWAQIEEIKRWHTDPKPRGRGWSDIGYHFLIGRDGTVLPGRAIGRIGAHVKGHNTGTVGICLIGGHGSSETDLFEEHFTSKQDRALRKLIKDLRKDYPTILKVTGHNQYAAKACPGFSVPRWYMREKIKPAQPNPFAAFFAALAGLFKRK